MIRAGFGGRSNPPAGGSVQHFCQAIYRVTSASARGVPPMTTRPDVPRPALDEPKRGSTAARRAMRVNPVEGLRSE
jgi:hypothetical protein